MLDDLLKPQCLRSSVCHRQHIDAKSIFQTGLLVQHVLEVLHIGSPLQLQHDPDSFFG